MDVFFYALGITGFICGITALVLSLRNKRRSR
ncbi:hypothetical protein ACAE71_03005 (plasmid) [Clavibacter nebraskensis]